MGSLRPIVALLLCSLFLFLPDAQGAVAPRLAAGEFHAVALNSEGYVYAWGKNGNGQLGNGTTTNSATPVNVGGGLADAVAVAAGGSHSLALKGDGTLWAWGENAYGQLGDGSTTDRTTPVQVLTGVVAVSAGQWHTLALKTDGTLWAWGRNANGQLGDGTTSDRATPVPVSLSGVAALQGGRYHSVALTNDGTVWCWGGNANGQLGNGGTGGDISTPDRVSGLSGVTGIASGSDHTLALRGDGTLWGWGRNNHGQLGDGAKTDSPVPVAAAAGFTGVAGLSLGSDHSAVLREDGTVWGWGSNLSGQMGVGSLSDFTAPVQAAGVEGAVQVVAGGGFTLALDGAGKVQGWGDNAAGELGFASASAYNAPVRLNGLSGIVTVAVGNYHMLALKDDGTVWAWGNNESGQLGQGNIAPVGAAPVQVPGVSDVVAIAAGGSFSIALKRDGTALAWGYNYSGQLGTSCPHWYCASPLPVNGLTDATALSAEHYFPLALKSDGTVWRAWGNAVSQIPGLVNISSISASSGGYHTAALKNDGTVWLWSAVGFSGGPENRTAVQVGGLSDIASVAAGNGSTLALTHSGVLWAWGLNAYGQLGDGTYTKRSTPGLVTELGMVTDQKVTAITANSGTSVALTGDGSVWAWGAAWNGVFGSGWFNGPYTFVPHRVLLNEVAFVVAGDNATVARTADGSWWGWGSNAYGTVTGAAGQTAALQLPVNLALTIATEELAAASTGGPFSQTLVAAGATGPFTFAVSAGQLPAGLTLSASGVLSGTPTTSGSATFTVRVSATGGATATKTFTLQVASAPYVIAHQPAAAGTLPLGGKVQATFSEPIEPATLSPSTFSVTGWMPALGIAAGKNFSLALRHDGSVVGWGNDSDGQASPPAVLGGVTAIAAGNYHALALKNDGTVVGWGRNDWGYPYFGTVPPGLTGVVAVSAGQYHSLALKSDGTVVSWGGYNGVGTQPPAGLSGVTAISAGWYHSAALKGDGTVVAWGEINTYGESTVPTGLSGVSAVSAGCFYTLALKGDGTVVGWGSNSQGALNVPAGLSGVVAISAGCQSPVALKGDGTVVGWGRATPVPAGLSGVAAVSSGTYATMALKGDGSVVAWGGNSYGESTVPTGAASPYQSRIGGSLSYDPATLTASFTPTSPPSGGVCYAAVDGVRSTTGTPQSAPARWSFTAAAPPLNVTTTPSLPFAVKWSSYGKKLAAMGGIPPYAWSLVSGALPSGLTLNPSTGTISGAALATGSFSFTVMVTDAASTSSLGPFSLSVYDPLGATTTSLPDAGLDTPYLQTVTMTGGLPPYSWVGSGSFPPGIALSPATGEISGATATAGVYDFTVTVVDANGSSYLKPLTIMAYGPFMIGSSPVADGALGAPYAQALSATGGLAPYSWSRVGGFFPAGISLASSGTFSGSPSAAGIYRFTAQAADSRAAVVAGSYSILVPLAGCGTLPIRIAGGDPAGSRDLAAVIGQAADNDVIQLQSLSVGDDVAIDRDIRVTLRGGYDCVFADNALTTGILGRLRVRSGTVNIDGVHFR